MTRLLTMFLVAGLVGPLAVVAEATHETIPEHPMDPVDDVMDEHDPGIPWESNFKRHPTEDVATRSRTGREDPTYRLTTYQCNAPGVTVEARNTFPRYHLEDDPQQGIVAAQDRFFLTLDVATPEHVTVESVSFGFGSNRDSEVDPDSGCVSAAGQAAYGAGVHAWPTYTDDRGEDGWMIPVSTLPRYALDGVLVVRGSSDGSATDQVLSVATFYMRHDDNPDMERVPPHPWVAWNQALEDPVEACGDDLVVQFPEALKGGFGADDGNPSTDRGRLEYAEDTEIEHTFLPVPGTEALFNWGPTYCLSGVQPGQDVTIAAVDDDDNRAVHRFVAPPTLGGSTP